MLEAGFQYRFLNPKQCSVTFLFLIKCPISSEFPGTETWHVV